MASDPRSELYADTGSMSDDQAADLVAEINIRTGSDLRSVGLAEHGGSGGALYVRWPDDRPAVVTRTPISLERMRQTANVLAMIRSRGLPVPLHHLVVGLGDGSVATVQERLTGEPARRVDAHVIDAMVAMNERFAGLLTERSEVPIQPLCLRHSGSLYPHHELLENHSTRSRRLLERIREIGRAEPHEMNGYDLVHPDYSFGNVLYDNDGQVTGVVDWTWGAGRGDRHFALVRIYTDLYWSNLDQDSGEYNVQPSAFERLDHVLENVIDPDRLLMYWAHTTLNQLHWAILYGPPEVVDLFLRFGESRLS